MRTYGELLLKRRIMYKFIVFLVIELFLIIEDGHSVVWTKTYGGTGYELGYSVQQTADGGYIVVGKTESYGAGSSDIWLVRTDSLGDILWTRTYGTTDDDDGYSVQQTVDGGYIVTGATVTGAWFYGGGPWDVWLIRTDSLGDSLWSKTYGGINLDCGVSVQQTTDGGYIVAGRTESYGGGSSDIWLIKTNPLGNILWEKTYGGAGYELGYSVDQTVDGGYILTGKTGSDDIWLIRTDSLGDTLWARAYGGTELDCGYSVQQTLDCGYIVTGETWSYGVGNGDIWLIRTDSLGDTLWTRTYGGTDYESGYSVQQTADGGYIVVGKTESYGAGSSDVWLIRTDSLGDILWAMAYGGARADGGRSVQQTLDGGYIVVGGTSSYGAGGFDIWLIKTDSLGNVCGMEENVKFKMQNAKLEVSPNPFSPDKIGVISYQLPVTSKVLLKIFDISGRLIKTLVNEIKEAGYYYTNLDTKGMIGSIYFLKLETYGKIITKKIVMLK